MFRRVMVCSAGGEESFALVQHLAWAGCKTSPVTGSSSAGTKSWLHFSASGVARILVVVCKSHCEWRHTNALSRVKVTSHSIIPAPMRAAAS